MLADWLTPALTFAGALGPALLAQAQLPRSQARALVLVALAGIAATTLGLAFRSAPRVLLLDGILSGALVALSAVGIARRWAVLTWIVAAALVGRAAYRVSEEPTVAVLAGALLWGAACVLAVALATLRYRSQTIS